MKEVRQKHFEKTSADLEDFVIVKEDGNYVGKIKSQIVRTIKGNIIKAGNRKIFDRIKADFQGQGELTVENGVIAKPRIHSAYMLVSTQLDSIEKNDRAFRDATEKLPGDPIFNPSPDAELFMYQLLAWVGAADYFRKLNLPFNPWTAYTTGEKGRLTDTFSGIVSELDAPQLSVLVTLAAMHTNHFVYPVLFVKGLCTAREYARAVFAGSRDVSLITGYTPAAGELFAASKGGTGEDGEDAVSRIISSYQKDCSVCARYLNAARD